MPAIYLFHRKTLSGGDDLHLPCLWSCWMRILQLCALLIPIWWHLTTSARDRGGWYSYVLLDPNDDASCRHVALVSTLVDMLCSRFHHSCRRGTRTGIAFLASESRGTPTEPGDRSEKVQALLELKLVPFSVLSSARRLVGLDGRGGVCLELQQCVSTRRTQWISGKA